MAWPRGNRRSRLNRAALFQGVPPRAAQNPITVVHRDEEEPHALIVTLASPTGFADGHQFAIIPPWDFIAASGGGQVFPYAMTQVSTTDLQLLYEVNLNQVATVEIDWDGFSMPYTPSGGIIPGYAGEVEPV